LRHFISITVGPSLTNGPSGFFTAVATRSLPQTGHLHFSFIDSASSIIEKRSAEYAADDDSADPAGKLKAMFYRARTMLGALGENAGHELIIRKNGTYAWNTEADTVLDAEEFEALCRQSLAADDAEARLDFCLRALELYGGDFLPKLNMEPWVMPLSAYYHRLYLEAAENALSILIDRNAWEKALAICIAGTGRPALPLK